MTKRRNFSDKFKATVALETLHGDRSVQENAAKYRIHPTQVSTWKRQAIEGMTGVFSDKVKRDEDNDAEVKELHAKIGKLAVENDFWHKGSSGELPFTLRTKSLTDKFGGIETNMCT